MPELTERAAPLRRVPCRVITLGPPVTYGPRPPAFLLAPVGIKGVAPARPLKRRRAIISRRRRRPREWTRHAFASGQFISLLTQVCLGRTKLTTRLSPDVPTARAVRPRRMRAQVRTAHGARQARPRAA